MINDDANMMQSYKKDGTYSITVDLEYTVTINNTKHVNQI